MTRIGVLLLLMAGGLAAQDDANDNIEWAAGLSGRFRRLHDPVVATYALSQLGALVCTEDRTAGREIFRQSLEDLRRLTPHAFTSARHRLPVPSFTTLWNDATPKALKCAPDLRDWTDTERARAKMREEQQQANDDVRDAFSALDSDPDRAVQLVETALSVSDPTVLDIPALTLFLSHLRDRAPDVADELFPQVLDFIASAQQPSPGLLLELGKYLFTTPRYRDAPDALQYSDVRQVGNTSIANFAANRKSSSSDDIHDYIEAAIKVLTASNDPYYDPVAGYAIAYQMLSKVDDFAPDLNDKLRRVLDQVSELAGTSASQVRDAVSASMGADAEGGEGVRGRDRLVGQVLSLVRSKHFAEARDLVQKIDDSAVGNQLRTLMDFAASTAALERRDAQWAFTLSNSLRGGMKRALLYAGMAATAPEHDEALGYLGLGIHDTDLLPAEQRMVTTSALASAILPRDQENGFLALNLFVRAANDAYTRPHQGRFDPQVVRKIFSANSSAFTDSSLILANGRCLCEVVDTGRGRHSFGLRVPGVPAYEMSMAVASFSGADWGRIEGILVELRDETLLANVLNALAAARIGAKDRPGGP